MKTILCYQAKDQFDAEYVLKRPIRGGMKTYPAIPDKARNAGLAGAFVRAARHNLLVVSCGACRHTGDNRLSSP